MQNKFNICSKKGDGRKTRQERRKAPVFTTIIEVCNHDSWMVYTEVATSVDALLVGDVVTAQHRRYHHGRMIVTLQHNDDQQPVVGGTPATRLQIDWINKLLQTAAATHIAL